MQHTFYDWATALSGFSMQKNKEEDQSMDLLAVSSALQ
jgi:hypothetical protein